MGTGTSNGTYAENEKTLIDRVSKLGGNRPSMASNPGYFASMLAETIASNPRDFEIACRHIGDGVEAACREIDANLWRNGNA